jgi:hypothetical protein
MKKLLYAAICGLVLASCETPDSLPRPSAGGFSDALVSPVGDSFESEDDQRITGMASNGSMSVAVGPGGRIAYSSNGKSWTVAEGSPDSPDKRYHVRTNVPIVFSSVTYGEGYFFAGGDGGQAAFSQDGIHWETGVIGPMSPKDIHGVAAGKLKGRSVFVAVGDDGRICYSNGGPQTQWTAATLTPFGQVDNWGETIHAVAFGTVDGSGIFVAVGDDGKIAFANDLSGRWYGGRSGSSRILRAVAFGKDRFVAVGDVGMVKYTSDPTNYNWTSGDGSIFGLRNLTGAAWDPKGDRFVVIGDKSVVGYSNLGATWNAAIFASANRFQYGLSALTCTQSSIILGSNDGTIAYKD